MQIPEPFWATTQLLGLKTQLFVVESSHVPLGQTQALVVVLKNFGDAQQDTVFSNCGANGSAGVEL